MVFQIACCLEGETLVDFPLQPVEYGGQLRQVQDLLRNRTDKIAKAFVKDHTITSWTFVALAGRFLDDTDTTILHGITHARACSEVLLLVCGQFRVNFVSIAVDLVLWDRVRSMGECSHRNLPKDYMGD